VLGVLALLAGLAQINPVFNYGPYSPAHGSVGSQPDWYLGFVEGALRLWPSWDLPLGRYEIPAAFWPGIVLPVLVTVAVAAYPFAERKLTGDLALHNLLERPRDNPLRTALGMLGVTFYLWLLLAGGDDVIAYRLQVPIEELVWIGRVGVVVMPLLAYWLTYRTCRRLQTRDRQLLALGVSTGVVRRRPDGTYVLLRRPLGDQQEPLPAAEPARQQARAND
jgi:ubiquinol-cytochrome c reductase cytochrome b subunit